MYFEGWKVLRSRRIDVIDGSESTRIACPTTPHLHHSSIRNDNYHSVCHYMLSQLSVVEICRGTKQLVSDLESRVRTTSALRRTSIIAYWKHLSYVRIELED